MSTLDSARMRMKRWGLLGLMAVSPLSPAAPSGSAHVAADTLSIASRTDVPTPTTVKKVMTVDELIQSGQLPMAVPLQRAPVADAVLRAALPKPDAAVQALAPPKKTPVAIKPIANALSLQGIFLSSHSAKASIRSDGLQKIYAEGDSLPGGWRVLAIDAHGVQIERCDKGKCASKRLSLTD